MMQMPAPFRRWTLPVLACAAIALGPSACNDERAPTAGPTTAFLDGDGLFQSAYVTAEIFRYQHEVVEKARQMVEAGISSIRETGCAGNGERVFIRDQNDPNRVEVRHGNAVDRPINEIGVDDTPEPLYVTACSQFLRLTINGYMTIEFLSMSPLHYTIQMPMVWHFPDPADSMDTFQGIVQGMTYVLPTDFGGFTLNVTTPGSLTTPADPFFDLDNGGAIIGYSGAGGMLDCIEENGTVSVTGTLRIEDRGSPFLLVEEEDLTFAYNPSIAPAFADWPGGTYSVASLAVQGVFGLTVSKPADVSFDGVGGVMFQLGDRTCKGSLLDPQNGNPCAGL